MSTRYCLECGAVNEQTNTNCYVCGQFLTTDDDEALEQTLLNERYRLGVVLGMGGFSMVYRAHDTQSQREVAIKQITLRGLSTDQVVEATETFNREVSLLSSLHHPQVPQLYDHFSDHDYRYLVLQYLEGTTLETYLNTRAARGISIQFDEALAITMQMCNVLEYLHTRYPPIIFRDLKPGNIMRTSAGKLYLIDFGIARHFRPGRSRDTRALGSPGYAAPEQYGHAQTTPQADIYSLGALLYTLLTGQDPEGRVLAPSDLDLSPGNKLTTLIKCMLSPTPGLRPASARDVATELKAIRQQRLTHRGPPLWQPPVVQAPQLPPSSIGGQQAVQIQAPGQQKTRRVHKPKLRLSRRGLLIGLGAVTASLAIGGGDLFWNAKHVTRSLIYHGHSAAVNGIGWSPESKRIVSASNDSTVQVWEAATGRHLLTYQGHSQEVNAVAWSPDGKRIASASVDSLVRVWDATTGLKLWTYQDQANNSIYKVVWSPDGKRIAIATNNNCIQIIDAMTGKRLLTFRDLCPENLISVYDVAWSPDGRHIATAADGTFINVFDTTTQKLLFNYQGDPENGCYGIAWSPGGKQIASGFMDGTIQVWNTASRNGSLNYQGPYNIVNSVAWSPDGRKIASSSGDETVQVCDARNGWNILTYEGHTDDVVQALWSPNGSYIASASLDHTVRVWKAPSS